MPKISAPFSLASFLADGYHHIFGLYHGVHVSELAGVSHLHALATHLLDELLAYESGMPARSAGYDDDVLGVYQLVAIVSERREHDMVVFRMLLVHDEPAAHTVLQAVGLVVDFLQHVVVKAALAEFADVQVHGLDGIAARGMFEVDDVQFLSHSDVGYLSILEIHHLVGVLHDGGGVTGDIEVLVVLAHAHHQRT